MIMDADAEFQSTPPVKAATQESTIWQEEERFQSTPPVKAATITAIRDYLRTLISIHAAREGGDSHLPRSIWSR